MTSLRYSLNPDVTTACIIILGHATWYMSVTDYAWVKREETDMQTHGFYDYC